MTLNITAVGPHGIHQSSDFRLTDADAGNVVSDVSPKQIELSYPFNGWNAVLTYTGVGRYDRKDTCCWVVGWVKARDSALPSGLSFEDFIQLIRSEGTAWLAGMGKPTRRHSFVIGAFVAGKPQVVLISNFESLHGPFSRQARAELSVSRIRPRKPKVVVTGQYRAVSPSRRRLLRDALQEQLEPLRMRQLLASVSQSAATLSHGKVSSACATASLMPDGNGGGSEKHGGVDGEYVPHSLLQGFDMVDGLRSVLEHLGTGQRIADWHGAP